MVVLTLQRLQGQPGKGGEGVQGLEPIPGEGQDDVAEKYPHEKEKKEQVEQCRSPPAGEVDRMMLQGDVLLQLADQKGQPLHIGPGSGQQKDHQDHLKHNQQGNSGEKGVDGHMFGQQDHGQQPKQTEQSGQLAQEAPPLGFIQLFPELTLERRVGVGLRGVRVLG